MKYNTNNFIPKFLSCSSHECPEFNYILHTQFPRIIVEVADSFDEDDISTAREENLFFKIVEFENNERDMLVLVDILDDVDIQQNNVFDSLNDILNRMSLWHKEEVKDLENYK